MSLHSIIHHELGANSHSSPTPGLSAPAPAPTPTEEDAGRVASATLSQGLDRVATTTVVEPGAAESPSPEAMQRVFDVAPLNVTNPQRRSVVTIFIIACNITQMVCNLIGVAGGLEISRRLGVSGIHANWVAAAYP